MNKKITFGILLTIIAGMLLAACSPVTASPSLSGTNWKLVSYGPVSSPNPAADGIETSLKFGADGQVSGNLGCNGFGGGYTQKGDQLTFDALASTLMACAEPQMSQEATSFSILTGTVNFKLEGDMLTIYDASGQNQLTLIRQ